MLGANTGPDFYVCKVAPEIFERTFSLKSLCSLDVTCQNQEHNILKNINNQGANYDSTTVVLCCRYI